MDSNLTSKAIIKCQLTSIDYLPVEAIQEILARLPITTLFESKYVCHNWCDLINDACFANHHYTRACEGLIPSGLILCPPLGLPLGFGFGSGDPELHIIPDVDTCSKAVKLSNVPFKSWLPTLQVVGSCNGFVCFADDTGEYRSIYVCNPLTGEYGLIPDNSFFGFVPGYNFGFGFDSRSNEYKVVKLRFLKRGEHLDNLMEMDVHTLGSNSWRTIGHFSSCSHHVGGSGILVDGVLHWLNLFPNSTEKSIKVVAVSLADEEIRYLPPPDHVTELKMSILVIDLAELGGHLTLLDNNCEGCIDVWMMKEYGIKESWTKCFVLAMPMGSEPNMNMKPLLIQENGKIVVQYDNTYLFLYDPKNRSYQEIEIPGLPEVFEAVRYVATRVPFKHAVGEAGRWSW